MTGEARFGGLFACLTHLICVGAGGGQAVHFSTAAWVVTTTTFFIARHIKMNDLDVGRRTVYEMARGLPLPPHLGRTPATSWPRCLPTCDQSLWATLPACLARIRPPAPLPPPFP